MPCYEVKLKTGPICSHDRDLEVIQSHREILFSSVSVLEVGFYKSHTRLLVDCYEQLALVLPHWPAMRQTY